MPTLMTFTSLMNLFRIPIPTIPPNPCMKNRKAIKTPSVAGPQQSGVRRTNSDTTPLIPKTPRVIIPSEMRSIRRFFLPPFLGFLYTLHTALKLSKLKKRILFFWLSRFDSGTMNAAHSNPAT